MKILHLIDNFDFTDGCARSVFLLMREQKKRGHDVAIVIGNGDATSLLQIENIYFSIISEIRHQNRSIKNFIAGMIKIQRHIKLFQPDIVHSHHYYASNQFRKYPRFNRPIHVHTVHQNIDEGLLFHFLGDKIVAVSESTQNQILKKYPYLKNKSSVILNGSEFIEPPKSHQIQITGGVYDETEKIFTIMFVGRMVESKGIFDLLSAMQIVQKKISCRCVFVGDGIDRTKLENLAKIKNVNALFTGHQKSVRQFYDSADIIVVPSHAFEGQPMVLIEAGLLHKPVIACKVDGIPELIKHNKTGLLVEPHSVQQLADAIVILYSDLTLRKTLGNNLFNTINTHRTVHAMTEGIEQIYTSLLHSKNYQG